MEILKHANVIAIVVCKFCFFVFFLARTILRKHPGCLLIDGIGSLRMIAISQHQLPVPQRRWAVLQVAVKTLELCKVRVQEMCLFDVRCEQMS